MSRLLALSLLALAAPCAAAEQVHPCQAETPPCSLAMAQARLYLDELDRKAGYATGASQVAPSAAAANSRAAALAQAHPCQAETPPCSLAMAQARLYLDELDRNAGNFVAPPLPPPVASPAHIHPCRAETPPCSLAIARSRRHLDELIRETGPGTAIPWETPAERSERRNRTRQSRHHVPYPLSRELLTGTVNPCSGSRPACPWELKNIYDGLERNRDDKDSWHYGYYLFRLEKYYRHLQP